MVGSAQYLIEPSEIEPKRSIAFELSFVPPKTTSQQKRASWNNGKPMFFKGAKQQEAEKDYLVLLEEYRPEAPLVGPIAMVVDVSWPYIGKDTSLKKDRDRVDPIPHTSKPDLDNWLKQFTDCLVKLQFVKDDSEIVDIHVRKWRVRDGVGVRCQLCEL